MSGTKYEYVWLSVILSFAVALLLVGDNKRKDNIITALPNNCIKMESQCAPIHVAQFAVGSPQYVCAVEIRDEVASSLDQILFITSI